MTETTVKYCRNDQCVHFRYGESDCELKEIPIGKTGECLSAEVVKGAPP